MAFELVNTVTSISSLLDRIRRSVGKAAVLYVDLEGNNLGRNGTISIVSIFIPMFEKTYLVDVTTLGRLAFDTAGKTRTTLRQVFETVTITKVFFDVRRDSDALYNLYGISINGIEDLQLMEFATRSSDQVVLMGLKGCIEQDSSMEPSEKANWTQIKDAGRALFDPKKGGSYALFDERPLSKTMQEYCIHDVVCMPNLRKVYQAKLNNWWKTLVKKETLKRIRQSQAETFAGKGKHMVLGPRKWKYIRSGQTGQGHSHTSANNRKGKAKAEVQPRTGGSRQGNTSIDSLTSITGGVELLMLPDNRNYADDYASSDGGVEIMMLPESPDYGDDYASSDGTIEEYSLEELREAYHLEDTMSLRTFEDYLSD